LNLTPSKLRFGRKPSVSHLRPFGCKCFVLKRGNLDKFDSRSSDGILLGYTPHIIFGGSSHTRVPDVNDGRTKLFLRYQVKQTKEGIFVHRARYTKDLMKKFNMAELKPVSTPMSMATTLDPNENDEAIDQRGTGA
jgi:hypothetical protein